MEETSIFFSFDNPLTWVIIAIIFIIIVGFIGLVFVMKIKTFLTIFTSISKSVTEVAKADAENKKLALQNEHIKLRGHIVKCEYCGIEHTFINTSDIPDNCPNCGAALTYVNPVNEIDMAEKISQNNAKKLALIISGAFLIFIVLTAIFN